MIINLLKIVVKSFFGRASTPTCFTAAIICASVWALLLIRFSPFVRPIIGRSICGLLGARQFGASTLKVFVIIGRYAEVGGQWSSRRALWNLTDC